MAAALLMASLPAGAEGEQAYILHCGGCHGWDGAGMPPQIPDLRRSMPLLLASEQGRVYSLRVPGVAMSAASDADLLLALNWMLHELVPQGERFAPFTAAEVRAARAEPLTDPYAARLRVLASSSADRD